MLTGDFQDLIKQEKVHFKNATILFFCQERKLKCE